MSDYHVYGDLGVKSNVSAEQSVIGAILVDPDSVMPEVMQMLDEFDFLTSTYRSIYHYCCGYFEDGKPIDTVILMAQLGDGYGPILLEAIQVMPSIANWKSYAEIVAKTSKRHQLYRSAVEIMDSAPNGNLGELQEKTTDMCSIFTPRADCTIDPKSGLAAFMSSKQTKREYIQTGYGNLDSHTYISAGDYILVGGRPSSGKTMLTLGMMLNMARRRKVVYFSLETSAEKIFDRLAACYFGIPLWKIKQGGLTDWGSMSEQMETFLELKFQIVEAAGYTVPEISAKAVQLGAEVIFVDYLGLVQSTEFSRYEKITSISIGLHTLAQSKKICTVALSQLSREGTSEPDMSHLRESGQLEADADVILLLHNLGPKENYDRKLVIAKNKEGRTGALRFAFDGEHQTFREIDVHHD